MRFVGPHFFLHTYLYLFANSHGFLWFQNFFINKAFSENRYVIKLFFYRYVNFFLEKVRFMKIF
jgi:hypothetical protein